jgi:predicted lactoylglutathione lyase
VNLAITEIKAFVPASDFAKSKAFHAAIGFDITSPKG